ncbi:MAG: hypothetical protein CSA21_01810 [Deltaproteobacteria bacterium]|nr:MAG: hypothetical protein CSA21_01810 [Deltaproteobacteria bacterium]
MPGYRGHVVGGVVVGVGGLAGLIWFGVYRPPVQEALLLVGIVLAGALFPDVDTDSKGQNVFYSVLAVVDLALMIQKEYQWAAILGFCALLPALGHHRGWTHTLWAMLLVPLPIILLPVLFYQTPWQQVLPFYGAAVLGYFSHLFLDKVL